MYKFMELDGRWRWRCSTALRNVVAVPMAFLALGPTALPGSVGRHIFAHRDCLSGAEM